MLHEFLEANRATLIQRCRAKVALRKPHDGPGDLAHGIPVFLAQLVDTLRGEQALDPLGMPVDPAAALSDAEDASAALAESARKHGSEMMHRGFSVEQVVHDYGDLCQAITELATEKGRRIEVDDFNVLNRCLDDAIADAITEFQLQRERQMTERERRAESERLGLLAHELRDLLGTATLAFHALKSGSIGTSGATSTVLERSLASMSCTIDRSLAQVRLDTDIEPHLESIEVDRFIADAQLAASLSARACGCELKVPAVQPGLLVRADRQLLHSAVSNLLNNGFKFTREHGCVVLATSSAQGRVLIEVRDECGGLPKGKAEAMFVPFAQHTADRRGLGLGLSIARRAAEAMGGSLHVRNLPGEGCVFTIDMPQPTAGASAGHGLRASL